MLTTTHSRFSTLEIEPDAPVSVPAPQGTMPLADFSKLVATESSLDTDYIVPRNSVRVSASPLDGTFRASIPGMVDPLDMVQNAIPSLCERTGVPKHVGRWLSDKHPCELAGILNERLPLQRGDFRVRTLWVGTEDDLKESVRFFASDQYTPFDNIDLVRAAEATGRGGGVLAGEKVCGIARDTGELRARLLFGEADGYKYGVVLSNSEVGTGSTVCKPFLYRSFCENGMIFGMVKGSLSVTANHRYAVNRKALTNDIDTICELASKGMEETIETIETLKGMRYGKLDVKKFIAHLCAKNNLTVNDFKGWVAAMDLEPGDTAFHVLQGLTRYAHSQDVSASARYDLEAKAGVIATGGILAPDIRKVMTTWEARIEQATDASEESLQLYLKA